MSRTRSGASGSTLRALVVALLAAAALVSAGPADARPFPADAGPAPAAAQGSDAARQSDSGPTVDIVGIQGPIDATIVRYLDDALEKAAAEGVEVVLIELDSTGLLDVTLDEALAPLQDREVPVAVWVGPPGARATGGAAWLAAAADVVAVAPGTVVGAAEPAALDADPDADPDGGVTAPDTHGELRAALEQGGLLDGAVVATTQASAELPADAALPAGLDPAEVRVVGETGIADGPVLDFVALRQDDVLRELDGRTVTVGGADRTLDVDPVTATVRFNNQGLWGRMLHAAASPTLTYLLLVAGLMAIAFEFFQPGFGVAGLSGVLCTGLATYGLTVLPTRPLMAAAIVVGIALLSVDLAVGGFGLVTLAGTAALAVGSFRLYGGTGIGVPGWVLALVVGFAVVFFVGIMTTVLRAQGVQARAGAARVTGKLAVVRSMLNPEGHVFVEGALWRARAPEEVGRVRTGTTVRVTGTSDGLTLDVELMGADDMRQAPIS